MPSQNTQKEKTGEDEINQRPTPPLPRTLYTDTHTSPPIPAITNPQNKTSQPHHLLTTHPYIILILTIILIPTLIPSSS
jgi:hypothetical protein